MEFVSHYFSVAKTIVSQLYEWLNLNVCNRLRSYMSLSLVKCKWQYGFRTATPYHKCVSKWYLSVTLRNVNVANIYMENCESLTILVTFNFLVTNSLDNISVYSVYGLSHIMTVKQKSGTNCLTSIRVKEWTC